MTQVKEIIGALEELQEDTTVPKNVRAKLCCASTALKGEEELPLRVDKALQEMEELANDNNTQPYTRAQIWNIVSLLEAL